MDLSVVGDLVSGAWVLAKEVGKGGGGSTEEPTLCLTLLPFALGLAFIGFQNAKKKLSTRRSSASI